MQVHHTQSHIQFPTVADLNSVERNYSGGPAPRIAAPSPVVCNGAVAGKTRQPVITPCIAIRDLEFGADLLKGSAKSARRR